MWKKSSNNNQHRTAFKSLVKHTFTSITNMDVSVFFRFSLLFIVISSSFTRFRLSTVCVFVCILWTKVLSIMQMVSFTLTLTPAEWCIHRIANKIKTIVMLLYKFKSYWILDNILYIFFVSFCPIHLMQCLDAWAKNWKNVQVNHLKQRVSVELIVGK